MSAATGICHPWRRTIASASGAQSVPITLVICPKAPGYSQTYDRKSATAFFTLVSARYERGSIILTSNKGFGEWGELLGDTAIASPVLDRLLHHSHVLNIRGESYRLREKTPGWIIPLPCNNCVPVLKRPEDSPRPDFVDD